jgi:phospholipase/carboxylesterase
VSPADAPAVAVLLHGFGDRGDGLVPLARELLLSQPRLAVVALAGRLARPEGGRMWWPIDIERVRSARLRGAWPELERQRPPGADEAQAAVVAALRELARRGVLHERVVLAGFSQGAMLAVDVGLAHPELLRGVVAWSGAVLDRERWEQSPPAGVSFIVSHGQRDTVLPFAQGEGLHSLLRRVDPDARWVPFDGPHTVSADGRAALLELLADHNSPP